MHEKEIIYRGNTHAGKAASYEIGRPEYPSKFFDYLYNEARILSTMDVIVDIGCGTGKIAKQFLEYGNTVVAIEPDPDMLRIANAKLNGYSNYSSFQRTAERTGLGAGTIDCIFCGNSFQWFDREAVVPEFKRILRKNGYVIISTLGGGKEDTSCLFLPGTSIEKNFCFTVVNTFETYFHAALSVSSAPSIGDETYEHFCNEVKKSFCEEKAKTVMRLNCTIGNAKNLR